jgi:hypothetical protein
MVQHGSNDAFKRKRESKYGDLGLLRDLQVGEELLCFEVREAMSVTRSQHSYRGLPDAGLKATPGTSRFAAKLALHLAGRPDGGSEPTVTETS